MLEKLRKMNMKTAVLTVVHFTMSKSFFNVLIISGIIPFTWVNGGRSESFATQLPISIINIIISIFGGVFTLFVNGNILYKYKRGVSIICWVFVVLWSFGFILQLLGTPFEKMVCSFILILGVISNLRMAIEER